MQITQNDILVVSGYADNFVAKILRHISLIFIHIYPLRNPDDWEKEFSPDDIEYRRQN